MMVLCGESIFHISSILTLHKGDLKICYHNFILKVISKEQVLNRSCLFSIQIFGSAICMNRPYPKYTFIDPLYVLC